MLFIEWDIKTWGNFPKSCDNKHREPKSYAFPSNVKDILENSQQIIIRQLTEISMNKIGIDI